MGPAQDSDPGLAMVWGSPPEEKGGGLRPHNTGTCLLGGGHPATQTIQTEVKKYHRTYVTCITKRGSHPIPDPGVAPSLFLHSCDNCLLSTFCTPGSRSKMGTSHRRGPFPGGV